jgi:hypothetical protein
VCVCARVCSLSRVEHPPSLLPSPSVPAYLALTLRLCPVEVDPTCKRTMKQGFCDVNNHANSDHHCGDTCIFSEEPKTRLAPSRRGAQSTRARSLSLSLCQYVAFDASAPLSPSINSPPRSVLYSPSNTPSASCTRAELLLALIIAMFLHTLAPCTISSLCVFATHMPTLPRPLPRAQIMYSMTSIRGVGRRCVLPTHPSSCTHGRALSCVTDGSWGPPPPPHTHSLILAA